MNNWRITIFCDNQNEMTCPCTLTPCYSWRMIFFRVFEKHHLVRASLRRCWTWCVTSNTRNMTIRQLCQGYTVQYFTLKALDAESNCRISYCITRSPYSSKDNFPTLVLKVWSQIRLVRPSVREWSRRNSEPTIWPPRCFAMSWRKSHASNQAQMNSNNEF